MNLSSIAGRVRGILLQPKAEWQVIASEQETIVGLYRKYVLPMAALGPIATGVALILFGMEVPFLGTVRVGIVDIILQVVFSYFLALAMPLLLSLVINALAPRFGAQQDLSQAFKTAAYCYTAMWLVGIINVLPSAGFLPALPAMSAGVYAMYLLYLGLPVTMRCNPLRVTAYTSFAVIGGLLMTLALGLAGGSGVVMLKHVSASSYSSEDSMERSPAKAEPEASKSVNEKSALATLDTWSKKLEAAGKQLEQAQAKGDTRSQVDALGKMLGTVMGGGDKVEALAPEQLKALLPEQLGALKRRSASAERNGAFGLQMSEAKARYGDDGQHEMHLNLTDVGSAKGLMQFADWIAVGNDRISDDGYEKTYKPRNGSWP